MKSIENDYTRVISLNSQSFRQWDLAQLANPFFSHNSAKAMTYLVCLVYICVQTPPPPPGYLPPMALQDQIA